MDPDPEPSIMTQNSKKNLDFFFLLLSDFLSLKNDEIVNVPLKSNKQKNLFCWRLKVNDKKSRIRS
jgi:hypothetical protein